MPKYDVKEAGLAATVKVMSRMSAGWGYGLREGSSGWLGEVSYPSEATCEIASTKL